MVKIYIAGPDVFELDSIEIGQRYKKVCQSYGFEGLYPLDNEISFDNKPQIIAQNIYKANIELIHQADIVIANLNSFRGKEADSGTIWECGYAKALGKKVYGYMNETKSYLDSFKKNEKLPIENSEFTDLQNRVIENFDYPINLMIACSVEEIIEGSFVDVLKVIED
mgnify:CR=1 FL=1